ncbi:MAG: D-alanyl-D-alanine dipeptidase [Pseudomonadota bacterium]
MTDTDVLIAVEPPSFDVVLDIRYATSANITGRAIYARPAAYLRRQAADGLASAIDQAAQTGHRLVLFDAFRPLEAQERLWLALPDPRFVSDPRPPYRPGTLTHPRGVAVDLSLIDSTGAELDMGTGFDEMVQQSAHGAVGLADVAIANRLLLRRVMEKAGWQAYAPEWWHYQLPDSDQYTPLSDGALKQPMMA